MIHNISITTADYIIYIGDDFNIYTLFNYLGQLLFGETILIGLKRSLFQSILFSNFF